MGTESVLDIAEFIRDKAEVIAVARDEADMKEALRNIESAVARMRTIL